MDRLFMAIATGLGLGKMPVAPGTWGTLLAFPIHYLISSFSSAGYWFSLGGIIVVAVFTAGQAEKIMDKPDPGAVVIDEVAGMLVTLIYSPPGILIWVIAFCFFRFFDIVKPFPVNFFDQRFHGGLGIVLDDLMAGIYALICMQIIYRFLL